MISHEGAQSALRARLLTMAVCATGSVSLSATATGYARTSGSFVTDGFAPGMELLAAGFNTTGNNGTKTIIAVSATDITIKGSCTPEGAGSGRSLTVGVPATQAWENVSVVPAPDAPYIEEGYQPGPAPVLKTVGTQGLLEYLPMYVARIYIPLNGDVLAVRRYAQAILNLFPPKQTISVGSDVLVVRGDVGPNDGQLRQLVGWSVAVITIPLRLQTLNAL